MRRSIPMYMMEGLGAMGMGSLEQAIEALLTKQISDKFDQSGLSRGIRIPQGGFSGLGELGALKIGSAFKSLASRISGRQKRKAAKAKTQLAKVESDVQKINSEASRGVSPEQSNVRWFADIAKGTSRLPATEQRAVIGKAVQSTIQQLQEESVAPTVTKDEIMEEAKPMIKSTARAIAAGIRAPARGFVSSTQEKALIAIIRDAAGAIGTSESARASSFQSIVERATAEVQRGRVVSGQAAASTPASGAIEAIQRRMAMSPTRTMSGDVDAAADAFGEMDVDAAADAFSGLAEVDISAGADAF